ncbi:MAG: Deoxyribose-phosphate aldolase [Pseudomonadota bacterium]|jgi:deoxyribose-phosphate aldolase
MTRSSSSAIDAAELAKHLEHTLLSPVATRADLDRHCAEARTHTLFAVCVQPLWVQRCAELLAATGVKLVTVVGFPFGSTTRAVKAFECATAVQQGAAEIDMVLNLGALKAADRFGVRDDIAAVVQAADGRPVKVILETAYLTDSEKQLGCALAEEAGARFVKTSTGFARPEFQGQGGAGQSLGATVHDIQLLRAAVGDRLGVKASGGIRSRELACELLAAGADRIGTSAGPALVAP